MTERVDELKLVQRLIAHDREAWCEFVHQFQGLVCARIQRTAQECHANLPASDCDDICAEVFAGLLNKQFAALRQFEGRSSLATWLSVITRRVALKHINKRKPSLFGDQEGYAEEASDDLNSLGQLIADEQQEMLKRNYEMLSESDREILELFHREELGYSEISRRLGISINTVGPKLHRAHERLRRLIRWV